MKTASNSYTAWFIRISDKFLLELFDASCRLTETMPLRETMYLIRFGKTPEGYEGYTVEPAGPGPSHSYAPCFRLRLASQAQIVCSVREPGVEPPEEPRRFVFRFGRPADPMQTQTKLTGIGTVDIADISGGPEKPSGCFPAGLFRSGRGKPPAPYHPNSFPACVTPQFTLRYEFALGDHDLLIGGIEEVTGSGAQEYRLQVCCDPAAVVMTAQLQTT